MKPYLFRKRIASIVAVMIFTATGLCSCFDVEEHLVIRPDGSGSLSIKVRSDAALAEMGSAFGMGRGLPETRLHYPPATMKSLQVLFPAERFDIEKVSDDDASLAANIQFKDVNDLLKSPYAEIKSMEMVVEQDRLHFRTRTGLDGVAACRMSEKLESHPYYGSMMKELCSNAAQAKYRFSVTLPAEAASIAGEVAGPVVSWKISNTETVSSGIGFTSVISAACPAKDIEFTPQSSTRLDLHQFAVLAAGKTPLRADKPSAEAIQGQLRFQPLELSVTNSFAFTSSQGITNLACLMGLITLPTDLAPDQWGTVRLIKALEGDGSDLLFADKKRKAFENSMSTDWFNGNQPNTGGPDLIQHPVNLIFKPPAWTSKSIGLLSAKIDLIFFTSESIVKIESAVPEDHIRDQTRPDAADYGRKQPKRIINPDLEDAGIELVVEDAIDMGMALMVFVKAKSSHATLEDIAFFDRHGNPPPCILSQTPPEWGDDRKGFVAILPGKVTPPLSMACRFRYGGEPVAVSFDINNLNLMKENTDS